MKLRFNKFGFALAILFCLGAFALFFTDIDVNSSSSYTLSLYFPIMGTITSFDNIFKMILMLSPLAAIICAFATRSLAATSLVSSGLIAIGWIAKFVYFFINMRPFEQDMFFLIGTLAAACMGAISIWQNSKTDAIIFNAVFAAIAVGYTAYFIISNQPADPMLYVILSHGFVYLSLTLFATASEIKRNDIDVVSEKTEPEPEIGIAPQGVVNTQPATTLLSALSELSEKYKSGAISAEEYEKQKKDLIWRS